MATNSVKAVNVTKYDAGGSGDNYIADGYIKSVEKIWMDTYTLAVTLTHTTITICKLPKNKKITGIDISLITSISQTSGTISVGFDTDASCDTFLSPINVAHNLTLTTISIPGMSQIGLGTAASLFATPQHSGVQKVTSGTQVNIAIRLNNWVATTGTLVTTVRYT